MKKVISLTLKSMMIAVFPLSLAACDGNKECGASADIRDIMGTWEACYGENSFFAYIFEENYKAAAKNTIIMSGTPCSVEATGTYKIDGNNVTITLEDGGETQSETFTFEIKGETLKLAPVDNPDDSREFAKK